MLRLLRRRWKRLRKKVTVCFSVGQGLYIEPEGDFELNEELLKAVKDRMEELREARLPIVKKA